MTLTAAQRVRAQAKEATRRALLQAGLEEAIERGGVGTPSIEAICARAGYTRGAFYVHFEDRTNFVVELIDWVLTDVVGLLFGEAGSGEANLEEIVTRFTSILAESGWPTVTNVRAGYLGVMEAVQRSRKVQVRHAEFMKGAIRRLEQAAREGQLTGTVRGDVSPHELADLVILLGIGAIMWDRIGIPLDIPAIGQSLVRLTGPAPRKDGGQSRARTSPKRSRKTAIRTRPKRS